MRTMPRLGLTDRYQVILECSSKVLATARLWKPISLNTMELHLGSIDPPNRGQETNAPRTQKSQNAKLSTSGTQGPENAGAGVG